MSDSHFCLEVRIICLERSPSWELLTLYVAVKVILMTAINIQTQIPNQINTLESLAVWALLALIKMYPDKSVLETSDRREDAIQSGIFRSAEDTDQLLLRLSIALDDDYITSTAKLWQNVKEFGNGNIPASYTSN